MNAFSSVLLFLLMILVIVGISVIGSATNMITIPWLKFNSQVQMERDITRKTYDADNALYNYHWFKERYEAIRAAETKIENASQAVVEFEEIAGPRSAWTFEDKTEHARLSSIKNGLKNHYEDLSAEYNARAKSVDRAVFKDELPLFFSIKSF